MVADLDLDDDTLAEADEMAKQLASLSPKAARAVAAAARATTEEDRDAALAEASEGDDEPINRGLLLKFLSSVKS
jgi:enoyl-CoA hydratase/carnithine racemase